MSQVTTPSRCYLIFNSTEQSFQLIVKYLTTIAEATRFPHLEVLLKSLENVREQFCTLIALQLISQIDVWFDDEMVQLDLSYHHDVYAQDEVDLSFLQFIDIEAEALAIYFCTHDINNARLMGFESIEAIEVPGLSMELVPAVPPSTDDYDESISETVAEDAIAEEDDVQTENGQFDGSIADS